ncbi:hemicentin-2 isoform X2 [Planococcus citri]|uniref:hemicentin-2 isoform X2 n=1 Tax=Planococcus citri TaxID=170843 RepID=UPI0031F799DA
MDWTGADGFSFYLVFKLFLVAVCTAQNSKDAREGEDVTLECRFSPEITSPDTTFYWLRTNKKSQDNAAIKHTPLDPGYKLDFRPELGRYDLLISNASYERDNGKFECRLKAPGSGRDLHSQSFLVTVLTQPGPPRISPSPNPTATEGKPFELTCSSSGGSPEPVIRWFREGQQEISESVTRSTSRDVTSAVLNLKPSRTDDGAIYRCVVWNRAMPEGVKHETKVALAVNYYPRVQVGPENPLRVEKEGSVKLECSVDAKPRVSSVKWMRDGRFFATSFTHTINRVTLQDAGKYTCFAENGLGQSSEAELTLDVQYPPQVTIEGVQGTTRQREVEEGETVSVYCNVTSNPPPITVEWLREGKPDFRQQGEVLKIHRITADSAGTYTCRAVNVLSPTSPSLSKQRANRIGNASVTLLVRHRPGQGRISPEKPIAMEGAGVTLTCTMSPPGWPMPQYRWWREGELSSTPNAIISTNSRYTIQSVHLGHEGRYSCQATNEIGQSEIASVYLTVYQAPKFTSKLQPHVTKKDGDQEFSVTCSAEGKPKPTIRWLKGGRDVSQKLFDIFNDESDTPNGVYMVQSTLKFSGRDRPSTNQLIPSDSGLYSCSFENDVKRVESIMNLRVEHGPIILHKYNKVAYDLQETAEVVCKVQAYPRPEFQWSFSTNVAPLLAGSDGHYEINTTVNESGGDIFTSVLQISNIREADYGDYHCRVVNAVGQIKATIRLQSKGAPEKPEFLTVTGIGHSFVTLQWTPGFDGGVQSTRYTIAYRQSYRSSENDIDSDCFIPRRSGSSSSSSSSSADDWMEFDCQRSNPCNVTGLEQHQAYAFKVKAYNNKGHSNYSEETTANTRVDRIPAPQRVTFDPETHVLTINIAATCLQLVGKVETRINHIHDASWQKLETLPLTPSGNAATQLEATILSLIGRRSTNGRSLDESDFEASSDELVVDKADDLRVRVRLCLMTDQEICGDYTEAEVGSSYIKEASTFPTPTMIAIAVSCVVFVLFIGLVFVFCRCKRSHVKKSKAKDYEMESSTVHPSIVQQPPPPYYSTPGLENKALEHSMDLVLDDPAKNALYGGHAYSPYGSRTHPNGNEWVNMGYMENSYSNSNNGGSVNSQDSLWQMKMQSAASNANSVTNDHAPRITDQVNHYGGYDPLTHGGYRTMDDYVHYPHLTSASPDYSNHTVSQQDFASVIDKRNRRDPRLDSPYHDVNGLPNPYMDHQLMESEENIKQQPGQHLSISFDESLESGFSTPNSRNRRIIREIIV